MKCFDNLRFHMSQKVGLQGARSCRWHLSTPRGKLPIVKSYVLSRTQRSFDTAEHLRVSQISRNRKFPPRCARSCVSSLQGCLMKLWGLGHKPWCGPLPITQTRGSGGVTPEHFSNFDINFSAFWCIFTRLADTYWSSVYHLNY